MEQQDPQFNELFQQIKEEDARRAPTFARVWANAAASTTNTSAGWPVWRVAFAVLALLLCAGAWFVFYQRAPLEQIALPVNPPAPIVLPATVNDPPPLESPLVAVSASKPVRQIKLRPRKPATPLPPLLSLEALVSQWHSPTDFLLKTSGDRWLKEVPRISVPRREIKPFVIEQNNEMEEL